MVREYVDARGASEGSIMADIITVHMPANAGNPMPIAPDISPVERA